ncbi:unnamed protein product [Phytophthora fragariaefolia]|uniref:Unnamed protein product n=1 Tax=Phytophthora fragariaefolia TaxID=1490495 RepID=A0A9W6UAP2_9STRA|nr:unnamed protein product [Phytophthora fragariaefolia]
METMTSDKFAHFKYNFLAIEYSLYAQRFGGNMARQSIPAHIIVGTEVAAAQRIEVASLKNDLSRVSLDMRRRLIEITFIGRTTATIWTGWRMPLASRMITLTGYERQREEALTSNALIRMDYYKFTVTARSGAWTSTAIHRLLTTHFGMGIQKQTLTSSETFGVNEFVDQI